jgi:hypothetical protein
MVVLKTLGLMSSGSINLPEIFKLLKESGLGNVDVITAVMDKVTQKKDKMKTKKLYENILACLYQNATAADSRDSTTTKTFHGSFQDALESEIIDVNHPSVPKRLAKMLHSEGDNLNIIEVLKNACGYAETFSNAGKFCYHFLNAYTKKTSQDAIEKAIAIISEGMVHSRF